MPKGAVYVINNNNYYVDILNQDHQVHAGPTGTRLQRGKAPAARQPTNASAKMVVAKIVAASRSNMRVAKAKTAAASRGIAPE